MTVLDSLVTSKVADVAAASLASPFDAVIIGSGSAGITVARTLAEKGSRSALIEAGPLALLSHVQSTDLRFDNAQVRALQTALQYSPAGGAPGSTFGSLIGCVGGRGLFWNGAAPRFQPRDFSGWPIRYEDLETHYSWAESVLAVTRTYGSASLQRNLCALLSRAGFAAEIGPYAIDNHATHDGWVAGCVGNSLGPLLRTGFVGQPGRPISLVTGAFARKILAEGGSTRGVEVVDLATHSTSKIFARSVVLAAGGFESARLALVSGLPDPNSLIGRYISDHIFVRGYFPLPPETYKPDEPEVAIVWVPSNDASAYQLEIHLPADNMFALQPASSWRPDKSAAYAAMIRGFAPVESRSANLIEAMPGDAPGRFNVHLDLTPNDEAARDSTIAAVKRAATALGADSAQVQIMPPGASHHEAGGLRMGSQPETSVCDEWGRFRGLKNLVVADAATWPTVAPANPHLTIIALARRAALQLLADL